MEPKPAAQGDPSPERKDPRGGRNHARYWRDSAIRGLSLLSADFVRHDYAPHTHDALVIAVTEIGGSEFTSRGRTEEAREGVLLAFNPAEPHSGRMARSARWRYRALYLTEPAIAAMAALLGIDGSPYFTANLIGSAELVEGFLALHRALDAGRDPLLERERLVASFGELWRRHGGARDRIPPAPRDRRRLDMVLALLRDCHAERLTLETMAAVAGLTPFQLIGLFKRALGITPHACLVQIRLKSAIRHIKAGAPLADAALAAGFYDQSALTNHFRSAYGITPRQYRAALNG